MPLDTALLGLLHVLGATIWVGLTFYQEAVLLPAVRAEPEAGPRFMRRILVQGKLQLWVQLAAWTTVLAGLALYSAGAFWELDMGSTFGILLNTGVAAGLVAFVIALFVSFPAARGLKRTMAAEDPPTDEDQVRTGVLQKRLAMATHLVLAFQVLALVAMVLGPRL